MMGRTTTRPKSCGQLTNRGLEQWKTAFQTDFTSGGLKHTQKFMRNEAFKMHLVDKALDQPLLGSSSSERVQRGPGSLSDRRVGWVEVQRACTVARCLPQKSLLWRFSRRCYAAHTYLLIGWKDLLIVNVRSRKKLSEKIDSEWWSSTPKLLHVFYSDFYSDEEIVSTSQKITLTISSERST